MLNWDDLNFFRSIAPERSFRRAAARHNLSVNTIRSRIDRLAQALGMTLSSLMRKLVQLEKVGLAQRDSGLSADGLRCASLRPVGKRLVQEAEVTVRALCAQALGPVTLAHLPEIALALAALCQDETRECAEC